MKSKNSLANIIYIFILLLVDYLVLVLSLEIVIYLRSSYLQELLPQFTENNIYRYQWIIFITLLIFSFEKIYFIRYDFWSDTKRVLKGLFFSMIAVLSVIILSKMSEEFSRLFIVLFYLIATILLPISKRFLKKLLFKMSFFKINVKVVGNSNLVLDMEKEIKNNWYFGFKSSKRKADLIIIISKNIEVKKLEKIIKRYSKKARNIYVVPYMYHLDFTYSSIVDYFNIRISAIHIENRLLNIKNIIIKNIFEKIMVVLFFPFALILHLIIYFLIKLDSQGSVIFKQKRLGLKGEKFSCYKYRTMYVNGDEILKEYLINNPDELEYYSIYHKYKKDPRITRVGRFLRVSSLDEFPQFFNILRGDMNLIGPRPYMLEEKENIGKENEDIILEVKPGITGLWQVSGRNNLTFNKRVELDKWYIQNWSLWIDFVIFMKTLKVVFSKIGAK